MVNAHAQAPLPASQGGNPSPRRPSRRCKSQTSITSPPPRSGRGKRRSSRPPPPDPPDAPPPGPPGGRCFITKVMKKFVRPTITAAQNAAPKPATSKPGTNSPTKRNSSALITTKPSPIVSTMKGSVKSTRKGRRTALKKLSNTTTTKSVAPSLQSTPSTSFSASVTPKASTSQRTIKASKGRSFITRAPSPGRLPSQRKTSRCLPAARASSPRFPR